jgi:hypothetical protein
LKRIFSLILITSLLVLTLAGCASFYKNDYALMIGVTTSQSGAKVTHTVAAIVIDKDYKIVSCRIDALDIVAGIDQDGKITTVPNSESGTLKSKVELGDEYGMLTKNPYALAEWDDQVKAFEKYVEGKTRDEIKAITGEDGKATDKALTAGCTIAVSDFIKAIDKAFASKQMVGLQTKGEITLGVSVIGKASNKDAATASYTADFGAVAIVDGKILAATLDSKEVTCKYDTDGNFNKISDKGTKNEQGDSYGMVAYGDAIAEWYEQAQAFADTAVGKKVSELAALEIAGVAGCTMYAGGYKMALERAATHAR